MLTLSNVFLVDKRTEEYEKRLENEAHIVDRRFKDSFRKIRINGLLTFLFSSALYGCIFIIFFNMYKKNGMETPVISMAVVLAVMILITVMISMRKKSMELLKLNRVEYEKFVFKKMVFLNIFVIGKGLMNKSVKILGYDESEDTVLISMNDGNSWNEKELICKFIIKESDDNILELHDDHLEGFLSKDVIKTLITKEC